MAVGLFDTGLVEARLQLRAPILSSVGGGVSLAAVQRAPRRKPAAWVLPAQEVAGQNRLATVAVRQTMTYRFGVLVCVQNARDSRGDAARDDLLVVREEVLSALLGWSPAAGFDPVTFGSGSMLQLDGIAIWWQDEFITTGFISST